MDKLDFKEKLWGGIFGAIAIAAAIVEMLLNGVSAVTIVAAVKDVFGTLVVIVVFWEIIKDKLPKKSQDFDGVFEQGMDKVIKRYAPLLEKREGPHLYYIASRLSAINDGTPGSYHKFFQLSNRNELELSITKTVFVGAGGSDELFKEIQNNIAANIKDKAGEYGIIDKEHSVLGNSSLKLKFKEPLSTVEHAEQLVEIIDYTMLVFVTKYKKT